MSRARASGSRWSAPQAQQGETGPEHLGIKHRGDLPGGLASLHLAPHRAEPRREPTDHVKTVQDVHGVTEIGLDRGTVRTRSVGHHHLHLSAPPPPLGSQKAVQRLSVAVGDHRQQLTGLTVLQHRHVPVPPSHRRLVNQQHPTAPPAAPLADLVRPRAHQAHHRRPRHAVAACHRPDRHHLCVDDELTGQAGGHPPLGRSTTSWWQPAQAHCAPTCLRRTPCRLHRSWRWSRCRSAPGLRPTAGPTGCPALFPPIPTDESDAWMRASRVHQWMSEASNRFALLPAALLADYASLAPVALAFAHPELRRGSNSPAEWGFPSTWLYRTSPALVEPSASKERRWSTTTRYRRLPTGMASTSRCSRIVTSWILRLSPTGPWFLTWATWPTSCRKSSTVFTALSG